MSISASGIAQAIAGLNYRNPSAIKCRVLDAIRHYYDGVESPEMVRQIATDDLVQRIWGMEAPSAAAIQSKRKNLSSIKSTLNADLDRAWREGRNPEGIMIGPDNTFTMSNEAKDKMIAAFSDAVSADGAFKMDEVNAALKLVSEFLSSRKDTEMVEGLEKLTAMVKRITEETEGGDASGYDLAKKGDKGPPKGEGNGEQTSGAGAAAARKIHGDSVSGEDTEPVTALSPEAPVSAVDRGALSEGSNRARGALSRRVEDAPDSEAAGLVEAGISGLAEALSDELVPDRVPDESEVLVDSEEGPEGQQAADIEEYEEIEVIDGDEIVEETEEIELTREEVVTELVDENAERVEDAPEAPAEEEALPDEEALDPVEEIEGGETDEDLQIVEEALEVPAEEEELLDVEALELVEEIEEGEADEDLQIVEEAPEAPAEEEKLLDMEALELVEEIEEGALDAARPGETAGASGSGRPGGAAPLSGGTEKEVGGNGYDNDAPGSIGGDGSADLTTDAAGEMAGSAASGSGPEECEDFTGAEELPDLEEVEHVEYMDDIEEFDDLEEMDVVEEEEAVVEEIEEVEVAEDDVMEKDLDADADLPIEALSDEDIEFVDEEVLDEKDELEPEVDADEGIDGVEEMVKQLLAPESTKNWMQNVGLPVDMFDEEGMDLEGLERDTEKKKVLAARFDGYLGVMERYYNQFITIPEGYYLVGGKGDQQDELPFRKVSLPMYYFGKFPVTNAVFEIFVDRTGYVTTAERRGYGVVYSGRFRKIVDDKTGRSRSIWNPSATRKKVEGASWFQPLGPGSSLHNKRNHPVVQVSLKDAKSFAAWTGKRLPTEIEWEAAARTMDGRGWPWGEQWQEMLCNAESSGISDTTAVNQYPGGDNPFGVSDLMGNVMEWTSDPCESRYETERKSVFYVAKGGGWIADRQVTLSSRHRIPADFSSNILGFRCVVD